MRSHSLLGIMKYEKHGNADRRSDLRTDRPTATRSGPTDRGRGAAYRLSIGLKNDARSLASLSSSSSSIGEHFSFSELAFFTPTRFEISSHKKSPPSLIAT